MRMFYTWTMLFNDANTYSNFKSKVTFNVSQIRAIRRTIVKNGGASLLLIDKNVWPTEKQLVWAHFYFWSLLAISERRHVYFRSCPFGHKWNKFLHLVAKRQMYLVSTLGRTSGGGGVASSDPSEVFFSFFLDDKSSAPGVFNSFFSLARM